MILFSFPLQIARQCLLLEVAVAMWDNALACNEQRSHFLHPGSIPHSDRCLSEILSTSHGRASVLSYRHHTVEQSDCDLQVVRLPCATRLTKIGYGCGKQGSWIKNIV
jgi:hypothetical protein